MTYTAAFPQSGPLSAEIQIISTPSWGQVTNTGKIPLHTESNFDWLTTWLEGKTSSLIKKNLFGLLSRNFNFQPVFSIMYIVYCNTWLVNKERNYKNSRSLGMYRTAAPIPKFITGFPCQNSTLFYKFHTLFSIQSKMFLKTLDAGLLNTYLDKQNVHI